MERMGLSYLPLSGSQMGNPTTLERSWGGHQGGEWRRLADLRLAGNSAAGVASSFGLWLLQDEWQVLGRE